MNKIIEWNGIALLLQSLSVTDHWGWYTIIKNLVVVAKLSCVIIKRKNRVPEFQSPNTKPFS